MVRAAAAAAAPSPPPCAPHRPTRRPRRFVSKGFGATLVCTDLLVWPAEEEEEFGFVGFGGLTKGEADADEPAAKRHRAEDDEPAAAPAASSASLFGGGAPIE